MTQRDPRGRFVKAAANDAGPWSVHRPFRWDVVLIAVAVIVVMFIAVSLTSCSPPTPVAASSAASATTDAPGCPKDPAHPLVRC